MVDPCGLKLQARGAAMYGKGVYFASDSSKSAQEMYTKGSNMLLVCDVLLGKSWTVPSGDQASSRSSWVCIKLFLDGTPPPGKVLLSRSPKGTYSILSSGTFKHQNAPTSHSVSGVGSKPPGSDGMKKVTRKEVRAKGYDSVFAPRDTRDTGGVAGAPPLALFPCPGQSARRVLRSIEVVGGADPHLALDRTPRIHPQPK